jgi:hypothetical protein
MSHPPELQANMLFIINLSIREFQSLLSLVIDCALANSHFPARVRLMEPARNCPERLADFRSRYLRESVLLPALLIISLRDDDPAHQCDRAEKCRRFAENSHLCSSFQ